MKELKLGRAKQAQKHEEIQNALENVLVETSVIMAKAIGLPWKLCAAQQLHSNNI